MSTARLKKLSLWLRGPLVILAAVLLSGVGGAHAERIVQQYANAQTSHVIRDRSIDPKLSPAARARAMKAASIKKKEEARKFIQNVAEGEQAAASAGREKEVAK